MPALLINSDLVKKDEVTSLYDLLDPKWKGKMVIQDPRVAGSGNALLFALSGLGEDFWRKLAGQDPLMLTGAVQVVDRVVYGERRVAIGASGTRAAVSIRAGAPVEFVHVKEGTYSVTKGAILVRDAPHPNAALLLLNWLLTKEGQIAINKAAEHVPIRADIVPDWLHPIRRPSAAYKLLPPVDTDPLYQEKANELAIKIWGKR